MPPVVRRITELLRLANAYDDRQFILDLLASVAEGVATPTLEEFERNVLFGNNAIAATTAPAIPLGALSFSQRLGGFSLCFSTAIATDAANYWTFSLQYVRAGRLPVQITSQTTQTGAGTTAGQPILANVPFTFDKGIWPASLRYLRKDDVLQLVATKTGAPGNLTNGIATLRYEPNLLVPVRESFSRIDSLLLLGSTDTGQLWTPMSQTNGNAASVFGLKTGQPAIQVHSVGGARDYARFDAGSPNVSLSATLLQPAAAGLAARMVEGDAATPRSGLINNANTLFREDAGVLTAIIAFTDVLLALDTFTIDCSADSILCYRNGFKLGGAFETAYMASTLFGIRNTSAVANTGLIDDLVLAVY